VLETWELVQAIAEGMHKKVEHMPQKVAAHPADHVLQLLTGSGMQCEI
jgi:hypothetical protein